MMPKQSDSGFSLRSFNRRRFLQTAGSAAILPAVLRGYAAQAQPTSANNRINLGVIGMGWQGPGNTEAFLTMSDCQVVAACDIDSNHLQAAVKKINDAYGNEDCKGYHDYRELLAREDIDAVMIACPDVLTRLITRRSKPLFTKTFKVSLKVSESKVTSITGENDKDFDRGRCASDGED